MAGDCAGHQQGKQVRSEALSVGKKCHGEIVPRVVSDMDIDSQAYMRPQLHCRL